MEIRLYEVVDSESSQAFTCNIYKIEAFGGIDRQLSERFMAETYFPIGASAEFSADNTSLVIVSTQNDSSIEGRVTVKPALEYTNALRIVMSNDTKATSMRVYYTYSEGEDYSDARSVAVDIKRTADFVSYIAPVKEAESIKKLKIVFSGNSKGTIVISSVSAVCAYTDRTEKIGAINTCAVSEDGKYIIIKGTVKNENTTAYRNCTLALYELSSFEETDAVLKRTTLPTSTHPISTKFEFKLPLSEANYSSVLSKYAIVLYRNGSILQPLILVDDPKYVSNTANLAPETLNTKPLNNFYKGYKPSISQASRRRGRVRCYRCGDKTGC